MNENYDKLKDILSEMFQLNQSDLDFGIYRIMNYKRNEIEKFLNEDLLPQVKEELGKYISIEHKNLEKELKDLERRLEDDGVPLESSSKYLGLKAKTDGSLNVTAIENEVYSHLLNFFKRYYDKGDFISLRRYKEGVYAIPYEGEEVKLHWSNADQYYIKTAEYFRDYSFIIGDIKYHFKLIEAETEKDNKKEQTGKERKFIIYSKEPIKESNGELFINFEYKINDKKQKDLNDEAIKNVSEFINGNEELGKFKGILALSPTEKNPKRVFIEKYLNDYTSRNTFDYFIHKDLNRFLSRELDFYIKNEVMFLDDIDTENEVKVEQYIGKVRVIKKIGKKIIKFLAQIEEFQKKLWLKKKFITGTNYCITLDNIPEEFYGVILNNEAQINEWKKLFSIDEITEENSEVGYTEPLGIEFLKHNQNLVLDTIFFDEEFKEKIIQSIDNVDYKINGIMIHSENFQALNFLQERYKEQVKCIYSDPPYNTNASKILYKNGYEHSSWISLIADRLSSAKRLLSKNGVAEIAIDDYELRHLNMLMSNVFGLDNFISNIAIFTNPKGRDQEFIAQAHDYTVIYGKDKRYSETYNFRLSEEEMKKKYSMGDGKEAYRELPLKRTGSEKFRSDRPYMFFPFIYDKVNNSLNVIPKEEYIQLYDGVTKTFNDDYLFSIKKRYEDENKEFILPTDESGNYLRWRWGYESCLEGIKEGYVYVKETNKGTYNIYEKNMGDYYYTPKSLWIGERYDASSKGTNLLKNIIPNNVFDYPKSVFTVIDSITIGADANSIILDFFGGSGTTGHAVIDLNRNDDGNRKYILVEMGEHFNTVLKPRIEKNIYSKEWKDGKPILRDGVSHIFKYMTLESYEDTLNNLEIIKNEVQINVLDNNPEIKEQYMLSYMLNNETENSMSLLNINKFNNPFEYKLKIAHGMETKIENVDLVETFNYLLGLVVLRNEAKEYFNATEEKESNIEGAVKLDLAKSDEATYIFKEIEGKTLSGEKILIIWRTLTENIVKDNAVLDAYFAKKRYSTKDFEYDRIYVNGDNNLQNQKLDEEMWKVVLIEEEFKKLMFDVKDI